MFLGNMVLRSVLHYSALGNVCSGQKEPCVQQGEQCGAPAEISHAGRQSGGQAAGVAILERAVQMAMALQVTCRRTVVKKPHFAYFLLVSPWPLRAFTAGAVLQPPVACYRHAPCAPRPSHCLFRDPHAPAYSATDRRLPCY